MKNGSPKYESENANKEKNGLMLNIDDQQDAIKHLKEYYDIEPPWKDNTVCVTCNQSFAWKKWLEKHIQEKNTKLLWNYCGQMCK